VRKLALLGLALLAAGCGAHRAARTTTARTAAGGVLATRARLCTAGEVLPLGNARKAYVGVATHGAVAERKPSGAAVARFGAKNVNDYPTIFGVVGAVVRRDCTPSWYRVQIPVRPNGATAFVRASRIELQTIDVRIDVDVSARRLVAYRAGRPILRTTVAVGSPRTPTPLGRFYVNQRLVPEDTSGPFGPGAIGISAFSNVLTGWTQGGPVAIHGTNEPWSIGRAVSNGCIRVPNSTLHRLWPLAAAGTPVIIHA
jgi:lipoprotein-anchoring transpeptidase ErfK/SrfK